MQSAFPFISLRCRVYADVMCGVATTHFRSFSNLRRARSESYLPFVSRFLDSFVQQGVGS